VRNTAAGAAQRICGTQNDRIPDLICKINSVLNIFHNKRGRTGLSDFLHRFLKFQTVFRFFDCFGRRTKQGNAVFGKKTGFIQFHAEI
jgi:hypothetical protein